MSAIFLSIVGFLRGGVTPLVYELLAELSYPGI